MSDYVGRQVIFGTAYGQDETVVPKTAFITEVVNEMSDPVVMNIQVIQDMSARFPSIPESEELAVGCWTWPSIEERPV